MATDNGALPSTSDNEIAYDLTPGLPAHPHPTTVAAPTAAAAEDGAVGTSLFSGGTFS